MELQFPYNVYHTLVEDLVFITICEVEKRPLGKLEEEAVSGQKNKAPLLLFKCIAPVDCLNRNRSLR